MIEEASGTSLYETKREQTTKVIEKKDSKLKEMDSVSDKIDAKYSLFNLIQTIMVFKNFHGYDAATSRGNQSTHGKIAT